MHLHRYIFIILIGISLILAEHRDGPIINHLGLSKRSVKAKPSQGADAKQKKKKADQIFYGVSGGVLTVFVIGFCCHRSSKKAKAEQLEQEERDREEREDRRMQKEKKKEQKKKEQAALLAMGVQPGQNPR